MKRFWIAAPALARLSFRRALSPVFLAWIGIVAALLALREWAPPTASLGVSSPGDALRIEHGLTRQGVWGGVVLAIVPLLVLRAARTVGAWRAGEVDWLASRATSRATILASTWLGTTAAALLVLCAAGVLAEVNVGASIPSWRSAGKIGERGSAWVEGTRALAWRTADPSSLAPPGSRARFEFALGSGSGPGALVILEARRAANGADDARASRVEKRVGTRSEIEIELPSGAGDLELSLKCAESGDRVFLTSKQGELWVPIAHDRAASWTIFARAALALAAWLALALGFGAWLQATSAAVLVLALMLPLWMAETPNAIWPGADLIAALAIARSGRVPPPIDARSVLAAAFVAAIGLGLARWSLVRWRRDT